MRVTSPQQRQDCLLSEYAGRGVPVCGIVDYQSISRCPLHNYDGRVQPRFNTDNQVRVCLPFEFAAVYVLLGVKGTVDGFPART